ncbi:hypothetical protein BH11ACT8_BH11ACT8_06200 [soil metagenome]
MDIRPVADDQWDVVAWLWQLFRHDVATVVGGLPYADGRYRHAWLDPLPHDDAAGYLAWTQHPNGGEAPVGLAIVNGITGPRRHILGFWTSPVLRRTGLGTGLALDVISRHRGPWSIAFQRDNVSAGHFWRRVATEAFGAPGVGWTEEVRPVPDRPDVPPDHWIETLPGT